MLSVFTSGRLSRLCPRALLLSTVLSGNLAVPREGLSMAPCGEGGLCLAGVSLPLPGFNIPINLPSDGREETFIGSAEGSPQQRPAALGRTQTQNQS